MIVSFVCWLVSLTLASVHMVSWCGADIVARVTRRCVDTRTGDCLFVYPRNEERGFQMQLRKHLSKLLRQKIKITAFSVWCEN